MAEFASEYPKNDKGHIKFPSDNDLRNNLFPNSMKHPAKYNLYMLLAIIKYVSTQGETILDLMSGTGSIMLAAFMGRKVISIDIEKDYYDLQVASLKHILTFDSRIEVTLLHGDCMDFLPFPSNTVDHIIFSPPYASIMRRKTNPEAESDKQLSGRDTYDLSKYQQTKGNVGRLEVFMYNMYMEKIYKLCYLTLPPGGTMTVVLEDALKNNKRIYLSKWLQKVCKDVGFTLRDWFKRESLGSGYKKMWKSKGLDVVQEEDIIIFVK